MTNGDLLRFKTILVPVANPASAPSLLKLARALAEPNEGAVVALVVSTGNAEAEMNTVNAIEPMVAEIAEASETVKFITRVSTSVTRGILDTAREENASLILLGVQHRTGKFALGTIVDNVTAAAPCHVLIYRAGSDADFERIVIPADGTSPSITASQIGYSLAAYFGKPVEAIYIKHPHETYWQGRAKLEQTLEHFPDSPAIQRNVVTAQEPVAGLLSRIDSKVLLLLGISERTNLERWLFGDFTQQILNRALGPVLLTAFPFNEGIGARFRRRIAFLAPALTPLEQEEMAWYAERMGAPSLDYFFLVLIAAILATLGLLLNNNAVIIGAMLVAPLMQPLTALAIGLTTGRLAMIRRGLGTLLLGIVIALITAAIGGALIPNSYPTPEMLARGNPSLLDAIVAVASGFIGAYATARKDIPAALAGVAIAAALMPPLCVVGLALTLGQFALASGALLLFLANIVCILLSACGVLLWLGMRRTVAENQRRQRQIMLAVFGLLVLAVILALLNLGVRSRNTFRIEAQLRQAFAPAELISMENIGQSPMRIIVTLRSDQPISPSAVTAVQDALSAELGQQIQLDVVLLPVIRGS